MIIFSKLQAFNLTFLLKGDGRLRHFQHYRTGTSTHSCLKFEQFQNILSKIMMLASLNRCLHVAKSWRGYAHFMQIHCIQ